MPTQPDPGFKLSYEPNMIGGTALGSVMALLIYYRVLDIEAAGLWSVVLGFALPPVSAWIVRHFTTSQAKLTDAGIHPDTVDARAKATRVARHASKRAEGGA